VRIDDRLLHGQVAQGWAPVLGSKLIVIANDIVAADAWLAQLYSEAAPPGVQVGIFTVEEAGGRFAEFADDVLAAIVLVKSASDAVKLAECGADAEAVNVGGIHYDDGKRELLPFVFIDGRDEAALRRLLELGLAVYAQDVPGGKRYDVATLLSYSG
jgi:mannose/fructose/N-acetylgalactosamine-specific phosphotransferase system component IIB